MLTTEVKIKAMQTFKVFIIGSRLFGDSIVNLVSNIMNIEVIGRADFADTADEIIRLQPQAIIHNASTSEKDSSLIQTIKHQSPNTCYIVFGDLADMMFRVRCNASGANYVLDQRSELNQVLKILQPLASKQNGGFAKPPVNGGKDKPEIIESIELGTLFSAMNSSSHGLMFADRGLTLRHINPVAMANFKKLDPFLPVKADLLIGEQIDIFHRKPGVVRKIIANPANLPYQTQIIFGPSTLDLHVSVAYGNDNHYLGVIAHWTEISDSER
ncbi:MAG: hypothetical protein A3K09_06975 [Nitrospinae bacterium RIFCSPLOWO2_12_FULL_47_7]|nr:MAG: hypothetical protein A3K09_06975 [Nitrospinae bacterium RIFCSPLOWO2_12_FULL_47_7]